VLKLMPQPLWSPFPVYGNDFMYLDVVGEPSNDWWRKPMSFI